MPRHYLGRVRRLLALVAHWAVVALVRVGAILPIPLAVGGPVGEQLPVGTDVDIELLLVAILALVEVAVAVRRGPIADHPVDVALLPSHLLADLPQL